ncbi:MAG: NUDIX domain-containing protein [Candidatus Curtissbacteria bacterium]|nr:NUDIX domain-containing protein [Candidatus Curtissbacteria bacterium]
MKTILAKAWRVLSLTKGIQLSLMRVFQDQFLIGVTGIIFNKNQEVLLFKHTYRQTAWSLPGGYIKSKEHPFEALEREIKEESGLVVSAEEQLKIRTDRETSRLDVTVVGQYIGGEFKKSHEVLEFGFFSFENLPFISKNQLLLIEYTLHNKTPQVAT